MKPTRTELINLIRLFFIHFSLIIGKNGYGANSVYISIVDIPVPGNPISINNNSITVVQQDNGFYIYNNNTVTFPNFKSIYGETIPRISKINNRNQVLGMAGPKHVFIYNMDTDKFETFDSGDAAYDSVFVNSCNYEYKVPLLSFNDNGDIIAQLEYTATTVLFKSGIYTRITTDANFRPFQSINNNNDIIFNGSVYRNAKLIKLSSSGIDITPLCINDSGVIVARRYHYNSGISELIKMDGIETTILSNAGTSAAINNINTVVFSGYNSTTIVKNDVVVYTDSVGRNIYNINDNDEFIAGVNTSTWLHKISPVTKSSGITGIISNNIFSVIVNGDVGSKVSIHTSTNLNQWDVLQDTTLPENGLMITDTNLSQTPKRFFKAVTK